MVRVTTYVVSSVSLWHCHGIAIVFLWQCHRAHYTHLVTLTISLLQYNYTSTLHINSLRRSKVKHFKLAYYHIHHA